MKKNKIAIIGLSGQSIFMNVNMFHQEGETKQAKSLYIEPGGKGYNQAVACSRLGSEVYYLSSIGNDEYGTLCEKVMIDEGINTYYIRKEEKTALATIITNDLGDNQVTVYKGASNLLNLQDLYKFKKIILQCDILLIQNEIPYEVLKEAIIFASQNNKYVIYNPAPAVYDIDELLPYINLLIPNESEAKTIYNKNIEDINITNDLELIITLGSKGCVHINKNNKKYYNSLKVDVIDTTGAGDVFCAAIASSIEDKQLNEQGIQFAIKASALHIQKKYVIEAIPKLDDIK